MKQIMMRKSFEKMLMLFAIKRQNVVSIYNQD